MLDTLLLDANSATPLFTIETIGNQTGLYLAAATSNGRQSQLASVSWPSSSQKHQKKEKDALVTVDGASGPSSTFLKKTVLGGSRKFHIPGQSHPLKWKQVGSHWECTLCSHACTSHRAVATFEPAHTTSNAHLNVYTENVGSTRTYNETGILTQYAGVDMVMLLYLVLSSLLLTTPPLAWLDLRTQVYPPCSSSPTSEKYSQYKQYNNLHALAPMITTSSPSPSSSKAPRIDLLSEDPFPPTHSPLRDSPTSQSSSCCSSLPPSPLTPNMDLSPIHQDTFTVTNASSIIMTSSTVPHRSASRIPSPLVTCSAFSIPGCSGSSPTAPTPSTPTTTPAGPNAITPYHLPPVLSSHTPPAPSTPHSLHPPHSPIHPFPHPPSTHHHHHHHHQHQHHNQQRSHTNNALHLDTSHAASPVLPYTTHLYNIQFAPDPPQAQPQPIQASNEEMPPAYNEIEWTVRVRPPRNGGQLRLHIVDAS